jgi:glycerol-3-phosphate dehydrogenase (NAD(P)+)
VACTSSAPEALRAADALVLVVPSQTVRENARRIAGALSPEAFVIHGVKGLERGSGKRVSELLAEELPKVAGVCALAGPNLAGEIARGLPAATVVASGDASVATRAQSLLHAQTFRVYTSTDLAGVELAGSLKNVVALAAGIADGLGYGDNAKAAIITRGLAEITRLGVAAGAQAATFGGLAGAGDVMATCYSPLSRNRRAGEQLARGATAAELSATTGEVIEGIAATAAACDLARVCGVEMPIAESLREMLFEGSDVRALIVRLLEREPASEESG